MYPSVKQSIASVCKALEEVVVPELNGSAFASEQAAMIVAQLKQITDVAEHQHQYLRVEIEDTLKLLGYWQSGKNITEQECPIYYRFRSMSSDEVTQMMFAEMQESLLALKAEVNQLIEKGSLSLDDATGKQLRRYIDRQLARETAWFRLSGFVGDAGQVPSIAEVLKTQSEETL